MKRLRLCSMLIALCMLLASCATTQDIENLQYNMNMQDRRMQERIESLSQALQATEQKFQEQIESASSPVRSTQANLWAEIEMLRTRTAELQGALDETMQRLRSIDESQTAEELTELQRRTDAIQANLAQLSSQLGIDLEGDTGPKASETPAKRENQTDQDPADALYRKALEAFQNRDYARAQGLWAEFISTFPENPLVPNSLFWQGEAYYQMKNYGQAILSYQEVIDKHPKSSKHPAALLKQGISFMNLNKNQAGKLLLQDLVEKFPDTAEAKRAKDILNSAQ